MYGNILRSLNRVGRTFRLNGLACRLSSGDSQVPPYGKGAGKGGGAGGAVRESGGAFGEREAAQEEMYFRKLSAQQIEKLHDHHVDELKHLEKELKEHEKAIEHHKEKLKSLKKLVNDDKA